MRLDSDQAPRPDQTAELERSLIAEYLEQHGHSADSLHSLPDADRHRILREASLHASMRLTEVESRARYVDAIHQK